MKLPEYIYFPFSNIINNFFLLNLSNYSCYPPLAIYERNASTLTWYSVNSFLIIRNIHINIQIYPECVLLFSQLCPVLCILRGYKLPGPSVHGVIQERMLELATTSSPGYLPNPGIEPTSPAWQRILYPLTIREASYSRSSYFR